MLAMVMRRTGGPDVFEQAQLPVPEPGPGQVLIKVVCAGLNPADWKNREGLLAPFRPYKFPCVIGFDAAGTVAAVGAGVTGFSIGDRVFTPTNHSAGAPGSYAEFTVADADKVAKVPASMNLRTAAVLPVAGLTAWQALFGHGNLAPGDTLLINGGSGGVGIIAAQLAVDAGLDVAATASKARHAALRELGVSKVLDYRESVMEAVTHWSPAGVGRLLDLAGFSTLPDAVSLVRPGGKLICVPTLTDDGDVAAETEKAAQKSVERVYAMMDDNDCADTLDALAAMLVQGRLCEPEITEFRLQDVAQAHRLLQSGLHPGKIVLKVSDG